MQRCEEIRWCTQFCSPWGDYAYVARTLRSASATRALQYLLGSEGGVRGCSTSAFTRLHHSAASPSTTASCASLGAFAFNSIEKEEWKNESFAQCQTGQKTPLNWFWEAQWRKVSFSCQPGEQKSGIKIVAWVWSDSRTSVMFNVSQTEWHQGHRSFVAGESAEVLQAHHRYQRHHQHQYQRQHQHHVMGAGLAAWASFNLHGFWKSTKLEEHWTEALGQVCQRAARAKHRLCYKLQNGWLPSGRSLSIQTIVY